MQYSTSPSTDHKEYNAIDVAKFIASLCVIAIHFKPFDGAANTFFRYPNFGIVNYMARLAVPFFFVCSGFFLFQKTSMEHFSWTPIKKYVIRIFALYALWSAIHLPFSLNTEKGYLYAILLYLRDFIFVGSFIHLWYLNALIFSAILVALLLSRKISFKFIFAFSFFLYFIGLFAQSWFGLILPLRSICPLFWKFLLIAEKVIVTTRNGLFEGFIFVSMGAYFAHSQKNIKKSQSMCGFLISMLFLFLESFGLEYFGITYAYDMYLFLVPSTFFLFSLLIQIHLPNHPVFKELRLLSSLIYFIHYGIGGIVSYFLYFQNNPVLTSFLRFILIVMISILFSYIILQFSRKPKFQFLKRLY